MIRLSNNSLQLLLHEPDDGSYRGTRFDRSGLFDSVCWHDTELSGQWFPVYDPYAHDAVKGPVEEFSPLGFEEAAPGQTFIKPGVGILVRPDETPYERFRLHRIADPGVWESRVVSDGVIFRHTIPGVYRYEKEIALTGPDSFEIRHCLESLGQDFSGEVYNHNFWTMGLSAIGPSRRIDFPFRPAGKWRAEYESVAFTPSGIRFSRPLTEGESVYCGNIHDSAATSDDAAPAAGMPYELKLSEGGIAIAISGDVPLTRTILWANHRIACLEPYNNFHTPFRWKIKYEFLYLDEHN